MDTLTTVKEQENATQKNSFFSFFVLQLISAICFYLILCSSIEGKSSVLSFVLSLIFPASYCCTLAISKNTLTKALPFIFSGCAFIFSLITGFTTLADNSFIAKTIITATCHIAVSAAMFYVYIKKYRKTDMLVGISVVFCIAVILSLCTDVISQNGFLSLKAVVEEINSFFRTVKDGVMSLYINILDNDELFSSFKSTVGDVLAKEELTKEKLLTILSIGVDALLSIVRSCLPSLIALSSMAKAFVIIAFFNVFSKACGVCLYSCEDNWQYSVRAITARLFNTALFVAILGSIIGFSPVIIITCVNLVIMFSPLLNIVALKNTYRFMRNKNMHPISCILLMLVALVFCFSLFQLYTFIILDFIGVHITTFKERIKHFENQDK